MQQGLCYRSVGPSACTLPLSQKITKQICCCSRVGKAWGSKCEECPPPGTGNPRPLLSSGLHGASSQPVTLFPYEDPTSIRKTLVFLPTQLLNPTWSPSVLAATGA